MLKHSAPYPEDQEYAFIAWFSATAYLYYHVESLKCQASRKIRKVKFANIKLHDLQRDDSSIVQSSIFRPVILENSPVLFVTNIIFNDFACAPINISRGPIMHFWSFKFFLSRKCKYLYQENTSKFLSFQINTLGTLFRHKITGKIV